MTDAQYQALYKSGSMDTQTRVDYERYLAMQKFINNMNPGSSWKPAGGHKTRF